MACPAVRFVRGYSSVFWFRHRDTPAEPIPGRDDNRPGPVTSHLDPRTCASVPPPREDPIGGASTLEEARESYRAKLAVL